LTKNIVVIVGPTASGKTEVAISVAEGLSGLGGAEIVSADSVAVYRHIDIGAAKPTQEERAKIPHHLIDVVSPDEEFSASRYSETASRVIDDVIGRGKVPIVVGGTGLYIKALIYGLFFVAPHDKTIRETLRDHDNEVLFIELREIDPESASRINPNDRTRMIRAIEIYRMTGLPMSALIRGHGFKAKRYEPTYIGLLMKRKDLAERIEKRVDDMFSRGIVGEVESIRKMGYPLTARGLSGIGYKEIAILLEGKIPLPEAMSLIKKNTKSLAKRQMTWFNKVEGVRWFPYPYDIPQILDEIKKSLKL